MVGFSEEGLPLPEGASDDDEDEDDDEARVPRSPSVPEGDGKEEEEARDDDDAAAAAAAAAAADKEALAPRDEGPDGGGGLAGVEAAVVATPGRALKLKSEAAVVATPGRALKLKGETAVVAIPGQAVTGEAAGVLRAALAVDIEAELHCSICCGLFARATALACGHCFCRGCLRTWLRQKKSCPNCQRAVAAADPVVAIPLLDNVVGHLVAVATPAKQASVDRRRRQEVVRAPQMATTATTTVRAFAAASLPAGFVTASALLRDRRVEDSDDDDNSALASRLDLASIHVAAASMHHRSAGLRRHLATLDELEGTVRPPTTTGPPPPLSTLATRGLPRRPATAPASAPPPPPSPGTRPTLVDRQRQAAQVGQARRAQVARQATTRRWHV